MYGGAGTFASEVVLEVDATALSRAYWPHKTHAQRVMRALLAQLLVLLGCTAVADPPAIARCGEAGVGQLTSPGCDMCIPCFNTTFAATIPACQGACTGCLASRTWDPEQPSESTCVGSAPACCSWQFCTVSGLDSSRTRQKFVRDGEVCDASFIAWELTTTMFAILHFVAVVLFAVRVGLWHMHDSLKDVVAVEAALDQQIFHHVEESACDTVASSDVASALMVKQHRQRAVYLDNLKSFLTLLVVFHHAACLFNGSGTNAKSNAGDGQASFYIVLSPPRPPEDTTGAAFPLHLDWYVVMDWVIATNQAYFMGLFFFISGIFSPRSLDRKGRKDFLIDRFKRLGIPLLCWCFVLSPITIFLVQLQVGATLHYEVAHPSTGPPWFIYMLLLISVVYSVVPGVTRDQIPLPQNSVVLNSALLVLGVLLGVMEMLAEILFVDMGCALSNDMMNCYSAFDMPFPTQGVVWYPTLFALGVLCERNDWLVTLAEQPRGTTAMWSAITLVTSPINAASRFETETVSRLRPVIAGVFCASMCLAQLQLFRRYFNTAGSFCRWVSANAYAVYLLHPICLVSVGWLYTSVLSQSTLSSMAALVGGLLFTLVVGSMVSWRMASQVRKVPVFLDVL